MNDARPPRKPSLAKKLFLKNIYILAKELSNYIKKISSCIECYSRLNNTFCANTKHEANGHLWSHKRFVPPNALFHVQLRSNPPPPCEGLKLACRRVSVNCSAIDNILMHIVARTIRETLRVIKCACNKPRLVSPGGSSPPCRDFNEVSNV